MLHYFYKCHPTCVAYISGSTPLLGPSAYVNGAWEHALDNRGGTCKSHDLYREKI